MSKSFLIIGSGFNSLATAYFLKNKNYNVKVIFEKGIKGVLGSVNVENESFDLGYQFFDGLDGETETFIRNMYSNNDLHDFKYGASTFSNNFFYEDHAIPYWMSYGKKFVTKSFIFYLKNYLLRPFKRNDKIVNNLEDLYKELPPNIRKILSKGCEKHYQIKPGELEPFAHSMSTFTNFRQTLFNDKLSNFLKNNSNFFDEHLASRRKSNSKLPNISLYPKGKNMEFITEKLIKNLENKGVIFEQNNFENINLINNSRNITFKNQKYDQIIITTNLSNTQKILNYKLDENYEHFVAQIFIYFTVKKVNFKFQYLHINDSNLYCSRISNCSLYSKKTAKNNHVLIAEIPLSPENKLWANDSKLKEIAWNEILKAGIVKKEDTYISAKILKIPKTIAVPKVNFFKFVKEIESEFDKKFSGKVKLIGQGIFTRHKFVKELFSKLKK